MTRRESNVEPSSAPLQNSHRHFRNFRLPLGNFSRLILQHGIERAASGAALIERRCAAVDPKLSGAQQLELGRIGQKRLLPAASTTTATSLLLLLCLLHGFNQL